MSYPNMSKRLHIVVAITGASGGRFGLRTIRALLEVGEKVSMLISPSGLKVLNYETGSKWSGDAPELTRNFRTFFQSDRLDYYDYDDLFATIASGSSAPDAVVVAPCSMGTIGRIAAGLGSNLIERSADVALKERRQLVLVPRETPLSTIHLENMLRLSRAGAQILPAMPGYYQHPETLSDLDDFIAGKILDALGIGHQLFRRWGTDVQDNQS